MSSYVDDDGQRWKLCDDCESEYWPIEKMERWKSKYYGDCCAEAEGEEE